MRLVGESTVKAAFDPLNVTAVAPTKPVPVIVTEIPVRPTLGENPSIVGAGTTLKSDALVAVPPPVVTETGPVVAPAGTMAVIWDPPFSL